MAMSLEVGGVYDLQFHKPGVPSVRVKILGADQETPSAPCGAPTVPIEIVHGEFPLNRPEMVNGKWVPRLVMLGPGMVTTIPPFMAVWTKVEITHET